MKIIVLYLRFSTLIMLQNKNKAKSLLAKLYEVIEVEFSPPTIFISKQEAPTGNCFEINFDTAILVTSKKNWGWRIFFVTFSKQCKGCPSVFLTKFSNF